MTGVVSYHGGLAAEECVARVYGESGHRIEARRWRSKAGEIDLIARKNDEIVFIEVKRARDFATAAARIGPRQLGRIAQAAEIYLGTQPQGTDSNARVDVALVDGQGHVEIIENVCAA